MVIKTSNFLKKNKESITNIIVLILILSFLFSYFKPSLLFLKTTPTGGDTPAHNYLVGHLKNYLLPHGKLIGWAPGWWGGFPLYQYYFVMPYLTMALLSYIIPLEISFKIISILGIISLPITVFFFMKLLKFEFPIPIIASVFMLQYLFVKTHTMWGVNIYSTFAGEIAMSIAFSLMVLFLSFLYRDMEKNKFSLLTPVLYSILILTHMLPAFFAGVASAYFLITKNKKVFIKRFKLLFKIFGLAFLIASFWLVPFFAKSSLMVAFGEDWNVDFIKSFPKETVLFVIFAIFGIIYALKKKDKRIYYLIFPLIALFFLYRYAYHINLVNVRFWPFIYFYLFLISAYGIGKLIKKVNANYLIPIIFLIILVILTGPSKTDVDEWFKWNYEGYESKNPWPVFKEILETVDKTPNIGRVAYDMSGDHNRFGSSRVFEAIPYFLGRPIIEGGIVNSGLSSFFTYYIQCETSPSCAGFPRIVTPTRYNFQDATKHLELFNVKYFIALNDKLKSDMAKSEEWELIKKVEKYQIYELKTNEGNYVYIPEYEPILVQTDSWRELSLKWYYNLNLIDMPLVFTKKPDSEEINRFKKLYSEIEIVNYINENKKPNNEHISNWLILGPFNDKGLDYEYIDEKSVQPLLGEKNKNREWMAISSNNIFIALDSYFNPNDYAVAYAHTYIYSPDKKTAVLEYSNDDQIKIWLNNELIIRDERSGISFYKEKNITLNKGWNSLLLKIKEIEGGWSFDIRVKDKNNHVLDELTYALSKQLPKKSEELKKPIENDCLITETVSEEEVKFTTSCLEKPHIIKISYYPNWKVEGADKVYLVSPDFMLVYPNQENVRLYYGNTLPDIIGFLLSIIGIVIFLILIFRFKR